MPLARVLLPNLKNHKLVTVASYYNAVSPAHRSYADCEACNACYTALVSDAIKQYGNFDKFKSLFFFKNSSHSKIRAEDITATTDDFDTNHPLYGKFCVFTGTLERMVRKDAQQLVVNLGGKCQDSVTSKTNYLILGNSDYSRIKDGKSSKLKKAEEFMLKGNDIQILSENVFYDMVLDY